jgi:hypothetical protein
LLHDRSSFLSLVSGEKGHFLDILPNLDILA